MTIDQLLPYLLPLLSFLLGKVNQRILNFLKKISSKFDQSSADTKQIVGLLVSAILSFLTGTLHAHLTGNSLATLTGTDVTTGITALVVWILSMIFHNTDKQAAATPK
jgi:hypothetical protein